MASDEERDAIRQMVYRWNALGSSTAAEVFWPPQGPIATLTLLGASDEELTVWTNEAARFGATIGIDYRVVDSFQYEADEVAVLFQSGTCTPDPVFRFCRDWVWYKIFRISPDAALDLPTIDRVLASWFLGPNPLPGLLNPTAPERTLSAFEQQTIGMMMVRTKPNVWPDDDQD